MIKAMPASPKESNNSSINPFRWLQQQLTHLIRPLTASSQRRQMQFKKRLAAVLAAAALLFVLGQPPRAQAASITVNGTTCTLAQAINSANSDTAVGDCTVGSGNDIIDLQTDTSLTSSLPAIMSNITLEGNGYTINGNNSFRVLRVQASGNLTLNNITITGGSASFGGGIANRGIVTVNSSTISGNSATNGGGIYNEISGVVTLNNSTISGNSAADSGGGISNITGSAIIVNNSTISGNSAASSGGGILNNSSSSLNLNRSLISGNSASIGEEFRSLNSSTVTANNYNLLGENSNTNSQAFAGFSPCSGGGCTDISATSNGTSPTALTGILNTTLANNGGYTFTHALVISSPAVDQIVVDGSICDPPNTVDQRGASRANGANAGGSACDIGATELSGESPTAIFLQSLSTKTSANTGLIAILLAAVLTAVTIGVWRRS